MSIRLSSRNAFIRVDLPEPFKPKYAKYPFRFIKPEQHSVKIIIKES